MIRGRIRDNICRGVAQSGSALGSGPRGRRFKSCRPDDANKPPQRWCGFFDFCLLTKDEFWIFSPVLLTL